MCGGGRDGSWRIKESFRTETEDARERNAGGRDEKEEGERAVRDNGVAAFISFWIWTEEGGTERWMQGGEERLLM